jgi:hypothetical protein
MREMTELFGIWQKKRVAKVAEKIDRVRLLLLREKVMCPGPNLAGWLAVFKSWFLQ